MLFAPFGKFLSSLFHYLKYPFKISSLHRGVSRDDQNNSASFTQSDLQGSVWPEASFTTRQHPRPTETKKVGKWGREAGLTGRGGAFRYQALPGGALLLRPAPRPARAAMAIPSIPYERRLLIMADPRDKALQDYRKKLLEHKEIDGRLKECECTFLST